MLACGLAQTDGQFYAARALQGVAAALAVPAALSLILAHFAPGAARVRALGGWGAMAGAGGVLGTLIGGALTSGPGWQSIFLTRVPVAAALAVATLMLIPADRPSGRRRLDVAGAVTATASVTLLVLAVVKAPDTGWDSSLTLGLLGAAAGPGAAFVLVESRATAPLVPSALVRLRSVSSANAVGVIAGAALLSMFLFISLYMQLVLGYSAVTSGVAYLPLGASSVLGALAAARLMRDVGPRLVLSGALLCTASGLAWFAQVSPGGSFAADMLGPSLLAGLGMGAAFMSVNLAAVDDAPKEHRGAASGLINTTTQFGGALGLAVLVTLAANRTGDVIAGTHGPPDMPAALTEGFQAAFTGGAAFAVAGAVAALLVLPARDALRASPAATAPADVPNRHWR